MKKFILAAAAFLTAISANIGVQAQEKDKKESEKTQTTTVDAWREALPLEEKPLYSLSDDPRDDAEIEESIEQIEQRISDLERKLTEAFKQRDAATLKILLADDFLPAGASITQAQSDKTRYIDWALKNEELKSQSVEKIVVRVYGMTAIATVYYKRQISLPAAANPAADGSLVVTDVWVKRGNQWQAVSRHASRPPKS